MGAPAAIVARMRDWVTLKAATGSDAYSARTYGTAVRMRCRVEAGTNRTWQTSGEETNDVVTVYCAGDVAGFGPDGQITLPNGTTPPVRDVKRHQWPNGSYHLVVTV